MDRDTSEPATSPVAAVTPMENGAVSSQLLSATSGDTTSDVPPILTMSHLSSLFGNMP